MNSLAIAQLILSILMHKEYSKTASIKSKRNEKHVHLFALSPKSMKSSYRK